MNKVKAFLKVGAFIVVAVSIFNLGFGGGGKGLLGSRIKHTFTTQPLEVVEETPVEEDITTEIQIFIKENQIYFNNEPIELEALSVKLTSMQEKQNQVKLIDEEAKRITYKQVEDLLQKQGFIIIRTH